MYLTTKYTKCTKKVDEWSGPDQVDHMDQGGPLGGFNRTKPGG